MDPSSRCISVLISSATNKYWIIPVLVLLLAFSAYFSATETALTSSNKIKLKSIEANDPKRAKKATKVLALLEKYDKVLTSILIGNNIVNITASSIATVLFVSVLTGKEDIAPLVSTIVMTLVVLLFGEVTPKAYAKERAESLAMTFCDTINFFYIVFYPLGWLLTLVKKIFKPANSSTYTEDELITMVEEAENEGGIDAHESELIQSAIEFNDVEVYDIMVPRVKVIAIEDNYTMDEIADVFKQNGYSRLPVYKETIDSVIGVIHIKDFYELYNNGGNDIKNIIQSSVCVTGNMKVSAALRLLQKAKTHMAIVVDEFGGTAGIITMEDIIEELVGEIYDEHDEIEELIRRDGDAYIASGTENLSELFETMGKEPSDEEQFDSTTVGGFASEQLGRIPMPGESFVYNGLKFTVMKADERKVSEVRIEFAPEEEKEDEEVVEE